MKQRMLSLYLANKLHIHIELNVYVFKMLDFFSYRSNKYKTLVFAHYNLGKEFLNSKLRTYASNGNINF